MHGSSYAKQALADTILERLDALLREAREAGKPLELDPYREQLFELFVMADAAGYLDEDSSPDLSADAVCRQLAERWGLSSAAQEAFANQQKLDPEALTQMRLLWSMMRLWMEWDYAWTRWGEFHQGQVQTQRPIGPTDLDE